MNILVTGAGGMVGSHMVEFFNRRGDAVIGTYYKPTVDLNELPSDIPMLECDIRYPSNIEKIITKYKPQQIYHLAAQSYPVVSWDKPYETIETNINGTVAVFEAIKKVREIHEQLYDPVVVVACSSAEYGETLNELITGEYVKESAELKPLHPYGVSKVGQDLIAFQYYMNDNIRSVRARIFNSTGTRKVNDVTSDFIRRAVKSATEGSYKLRVGNLETKRAIMDQKDLIHALVLLVEKGRPGEVYNISSEKIYQMRDIVVMIEAHMGHKFEIEVDERLIRPTDEKVIAGDITKLKKDTGWHQEIPMEQTVKEMIEYWKTKLC